MRITSIYRFLCIFDQSGLLCAATRVALGAAKIKNNTCYCSPKGKKKSLSAMLASDANEALECTNLDRSGRRNELRSFLEAHFFTH